MKHVHAEVIKALADGQHQPIQAYNEFLESWEDVEPEDGENWISIVSKNSDSKIRIKPQPKAISWVMVYSDGSTGYPYTSKSGALSHCHRSAINILEVRDDGTAHLHKVEK